MKSITKRIVHLLSFMVLSIITVTASSLLVDPRIFNPEQEAFNAVIAAFKKMPQGKKTFINVVQNLEQSLPMAQDQDVIFRTKNDTLCHPNVDFEDRRIAPLTEFLNDYKVAALITYCGLADLKLASLEDSSPRKDAVDTYDALYHEKFKNLTKKEIIPLQQKVFSHGVQLLKELVKSIDMRQDEDESYFVFTPNDELRELAMTNNTIHKYCMFCEKDGNTEFYFSSPNFCSHEQCQKLFFQATNRLLKYIQEHVTEKEQKHSLLCDIFGNTRDTINMTFEAYVKENSVAQLTKAIDQSACTFLVNYPLEPNKELEPITTTIS